MREFMTLIGQIFLISLVQTILEVFLKSDNRDYQIRIINIACIMGSLYLVLQFVFTYILKELTTMIRLPF
ncbi:MAG: hypothetical protein LBB94_12575 [Clostridiales bacterium]|nr:hypothetical protein [Clostridiales bacterium]